MVHKIRPVNIIFAVLTVLCMVMIFLFSCENSDDSSETSGGITHFVVSFFVTDWDSLSHDEQQEIYNKADHIVRKCAHFSAYAALGFCASFAVGKRRLLSAGSGGVIALCFLYACSDELHQTLVPGRAGRFTDVLIDTSGGLTGMAVSLLLMIAAARLFGSASREH